jgi:hypothetical protein
MLKKCVIFLFLLYLIIGWSLSIAGNSTDSDTSAVIKEKVELDKVSIQAYTCYNRCPPDWMMICNMSCCTGTYDWGSFASTITIDPSVGAVGQSITITVETVFNPLMPINAFPPHDPCCSNFGTELKVYDPSGVTVATAGGSSLTSASFVPTVVGNYRYRFIAAGYAERVCILRNITIGPSGDNDGDGYTIAQGDCNDNDNTIYPNAPELCDNKDNDCDGQIDEHIYSLQRISPEEITIPIGTTTEVPLSVGVICKTSGSVSGKNVSFSLVSGAGASLSCSSSQTGSDGVAICILNLAPCTPGEYIVQARMNGVTDGTSPINIIVKVVGSAGDPTSVAITPVDRKICGGMDGVWTAEVLDTNNSPIGVGCLTFKWTIRKGNDFIYGPAVGGNELSYTFPENFDGTYKIEVTVCKKQEPNVCVSGNTTVQVSPPLTISAIEIIPPKDPIPIGELVEFRAIAYEDANKEKQIAPGKLNWQWSVNGVDIPEATNHTLEYTFTEDKQYIVSVKACQKDCEEITGSNQKVKLQNSGSCSIIDTKVIVGEFIKSIKICKPNSWDELPWEQVLLIGEPLHIELETKQNNPGFVDEITIKVKVVDDDGKTAFIMDVKLIETDNNTNIYQGEIPNFSEKCTEYTSEYNNNTFSILDNSYLLNSQDPNNPIAYKDAESFEKGIKKVQLTYQEEKRYLMEIINRSGEAQLLAFSNLLVCNG